MNLEDMREMTSEELLEALAEAKEEQFNLRFQVATNQLDNTARIQDVKKNVARLLTIMRELEHLLRRARDQHRLLDNGHDHLLR
jgi:large subunit ribosomal protein L29